MGSIRVSEKPIQRYPLLARFIFCAQKVKYGESLLSSKIWGRSPPLLYGLQVFYRAVDRKNSPIEPALRSLIGIIISKINNCSFCVDIGEALLRKRGVSQEKIEAVFEYFKSNAFSEREKIALEYAESVTRASGSIGDSVFERLHKEFSDDEIVELTGIIAYQNLASKFNAALAIPPQGFCQISRK